VAELTGAEVGELERLITFVKDRPGHDRRYALDASRLRQDLGWAPRMTYMAACARRYAGTLDHPE
jgi:dTDP-glucose 4,6-dehydratase